MEHATTQARIFAAEYAKDTASQMLKTIKQSAKRAGFITALMLTVSMPHQIAFILGLAPLNWSNITVALESVTLILGAVGIPVAVDFLILICIQGLAARAMADGVKIITFVVMLFPIGVSGTVNFMAPAPLLIKQLFVVAVVLIPLAEGLRSIFRPDFSKIEKMETDVAGQVTGQPSTQSRKCEPGCTCGRHSRKRRRGRRGRGRSPVEQIEDLVSIAPVSPAL
jgi:hypothetical protein